MEHIENNNPASDSHKKNEYQLTEIDLNFLKAVDYIIRKNKVAKVKPYTDNAISKTFFGDRKIVGKIRASQRSITIVQLRKFAIHFGLDFNFFFRGTESMFYSPQAAGKNQNVTGKHIEIINEMTDSTFHKGDVNYGGVGKIIEKVDKVIENTLNTPQSMEPQNLPKMAGQQNDQVKEVIGYYQTQLIKIKKELDREREEKYDISKKYISLLEQKTG